MTKPDEDPALLDSVVGEQIAVLRRIVQNCAAKVIGERSNPGAMVELLITVQRELEYWLRYQQGQPALAPQRTPPPPLYGGRSAPPLEDGEDALALEGEDTYGETGMKMPPEPLWTEERIIYGEEDNR